MRKLNTIFKTIINHLLYTSSIFKNIILMFLQKNVKKMFNFTLILVFALIFLSVNLSEVNYNNNKNISTEWNQYHTVSQQDSLIKGVPWTGEPGITETVQQIMERESMFPQDYYPKLKTKGNPDIEENEYPIVPENPDAPKEFQWPPRNQDQKEGETGQTDNPQIVGTSFLGPVVSESGYIPPDTQGDVGPAQILMSSNGRIKVYSKTGILGSLNSDMDVFFNSVRNGGATTDPHIRYDRLSQRWYVVIINIPASGANRILIARSSGPVITNASSFTFFQFQQDLAGTPGADAGAFADYPTLGVDKFSLYIGCNMFNPSYIGTSVWVINKSDLNSSILTVTGFHQISSGTTEGPRTPQGVDNDDPSATEGYFIGVSNFSYSRLTIRRVTYPGGIPSLSGNLNINVNATGPVIDVPCLGTSGLLDGIDDRLYAAEIHKNKITNTISLWTAHHTQVNSSGVYNTTGGRLGSRWYEVTNLTTSPTLNQSGTFFDNAASNPRSFWMPSCVMSGQGHMAIASSSAGALNRAEIVGAGRFRTDAPGTIQATTLMQSSSTSYNLQANGRWRWGDYSQTVVDPNDDQTIWTFQEYCNANNSWGVRAIQLKAPPPASPSSSSITNIAPGQPSVNIVITGTSVSGSEFFDPGADISGPGYANHIAAAISGGVTVNSVTFMDPTHITLNISTVGSPAGFKNITVTNPDGQSATGNNLININVPTSSFCIDFNNRDLSRIISEGCDTSTVSPGPSGDISDYYFRIVDHSGPAQNYSTDYSGNWNSSYSGKCLCFDFRLIDDGGVPPPLPPAKTHTLSILYGPIYPGSPRATFVVDIVNVIDGWVHFCAPIGECSGNTLPGNSQGQWEIFGGSYPNNCDSWNLFLNNVSGLFINGDVTGSSHEIAGYDNICMESCTDTSCVSILSDTTYCDSTGKYIYEFQIHNNSPTKYIEQLEITVDSPQPPNYVVTVPSTINFSTPIPPLGASGVQRVKLIGPGASAYAEVCYTLSAQFLHDDCPWCCYIENCIKLPICSCAEVIQDSIYCVNDEYFYKFTLKNGTQYDVTKIQLTSPGSIPVTFVPQIFHFGTPIAPGQLFPTLTAQMIGGAAGQTIPVRIKLFSNDFECCYFELSYTLPPCDTLLMNLRSFIEGRYDPATNTMIGSNVEVELRNSSPPYSLVESSAGYLNSSGNCELKFYNAQNGVNYYIVLKNSNSLETWSRSPGQSFNNDLLNYDFLSVSQAYGMNLELIDSAPVYYGILSGDVNQDGEIDLTDVLTIYNDATIFITGNSDLNGDGITDLTDIVISYNNALDFASVIRP